MFHAVCTATAETARLGKRLLFRRFKVGVIIASKGGRAERENEPQYLSGTARPGDAPNRVNISPGRVSSRLSCIVGYGPGERCLGAVRVAPGPAGKTGVNRMGSGVQGSGREAQFFNEIRLIFN